MKNMGLGRLTLVGAPVDLNEPAARALAYGAWDVLDAVRHARTLGEAVAECTLVAATSLRASGDWTPRRFAEEAGALAAGGRLAIVFGPESTGLTREELALCHLQVRIPTAAAQPSLNLAQAVLVLAYEIHVAAERGAERTGPGDAGGPAAKSEAPQTGDLESVLAHLRKALLSIGFLNPANPDILLAELRQLLWRAQPRPRELALLHGLARQVGWAGSEIARVEAGPDNSRAKGAP